MNLDRPFLAGAAALAILAVAACAGAPEPEIGAGDLCVDDSAHCVGQRRSALGQLVADRDRAWVRQAPTPAAYASGVRLFAFKTKKKELSCEELAIGRREAEGAAAALGGAVTGALTPAQVSRGKMFAVEVGRELAAEHAKRCRRNKS